MTKNLLIVESPSKAKTLNKYLGKDFQIVASFGHVRDLIPKSGAIDPNDNFSMKYQIIDKNKKHIENIIKEAKNSENIYLATDPDREGEAISWHIDEILKKKIDLKKTSILRVTFNEITKSAVLESIKTPRQISTTLVDAQQTRRALDYLVGFNLSPLLWKKIRKGLSAGRVQSPALRLICEREIEIKNFTSQEYWSIHLLFNKNKTDFIAKLYSLNNKKVSLLDINSEKQKDDIINSLTDKNSVVINIERKKRSRKTVSPFTTSTLQQEAVKKLYFSTDKTMRVAQKLYEGINIKDEIYGLITYMRTDSLSLSKEAVDEVRNYISNNFDKKYLPKSANIFKTKAKNAQEAHEAIRPTSIFRTPKSLKEFLNEDAYKLYDMIWKRTLACQMSNASFENTSIDLKVNNAIFRLTGQIQIFDGFLKVYQENDKEENNIQKLPNFDINEIINIKKLYGEQHFTQPPARYSEASLVKALEEYGIGRPSTYASIISTLQDREYATLEQKRFVPTDIGMIVNKFLTEHFNQYVDYDFTAKLEDDLDKIASGNKKWLPIMRSFWKNFSNNIKEKENIPRDKITSQQLDEICPKCNKHNLVIKYGKKGKFIACSGYPECDYTRNVNTTSQDVNQDNKEVIQIIEDRPCPKCNGQLIYKFGKYGKFIACKNYPKCNYKESLVKHKNTGIKCPNCNTGDLVEKKNRYGKIFYGCSEYPKCNYAIWNQPIQENCPKCNWPILTIKETKKRGKEKICPQKECTYIKQEN